MQRLTYRNSRSSLQLDHVRMLVWFHLGWRILMAARRDPQTPSKQPMVCAKCGGHFRLVAFTDHLGRVLFSHPLPYLDSG